MLIMNEEKQLLEGVFTNRELNASVGRKVITTLLDANDHIVKIDKLAWVTKMVGSLDKLDDADNLGSRRLSNVLLRYHMTSSEQFTHFEPVTPQYIRDLRMGSLFP